MKKPHIILIVVAFCITILFVGLFVFLNNNTLSAKITNFEITGYDNNANVGVAWNYHFELVFLNNGTVDIENAIVIFRTNSTYNIDRTIVGSINSSEVFREGFSLRMGELCSLGSVKVGDEKKFYGIIKNDLADYAKIRGFAFTATIQSNDTLLDQAAIIIP